MLDIKLQSTKIGDTVKKYKINYIVNNDIKENKNFKMMTFIKNKYDKFIHIVLKYWEVIIMGRFQINKIIVNKKGNFCSINKMNIFDSYNDYQIEIVYEKYTYKKHITLEINNTCVLKHSLCDNIFYIESDNDKKYDEIKNYVEKNYNKIMDYYRMLVTYQSGL